MHSITMDMDNNVVKVWGGAGWRGAKEGAMGERGHLQ